MCDPITLAGLALTAGSFVTSAIANNQVEEQRSQVALSEATRQENLQRQAIGQIDTATERFTPETVNQGIEEAAQARIDRLQGNVEGAGDQDPNDLPLTASAPRIVRETAARELNKGLGEGKSFAARLGRLGAFGESSFQRNIDLGRLGETLGQLGTESRNSAAITPLEFESANRKGGTLRGISDILGGLGSAANLGSSVGFSPFNKGPSPLPDVFADVL